MRKIAVVHSGSSQHQRTFNEPKYNKYISEIIYFPDLAETSLDEFDVLLMPSQLHKGLLEKNKEKIHAFSDQGGIVVSFGPQPCEWIPNQKWEFRPTNFWWWLEKDAKSGLVFPNKDYGMFHYLTEADCTWHQHGVYWPPKGVKPLITMEDGGVVMYVDKISTKGTWIVTTLDPDYHFGMYFMPATEQFLDGFFPWLAEGEI